MALIILPRSGNPGGATEAQIKLQAAIDDPLTVIMIVYGEGPEVEHALQTCAGRALAKPAIRRVVWCPDPEVLSVQQKKNVWQSGMGVVSVGLADKLADALTIKRAGVRLFVENAFITAEKQLP